MDTTGCYLTAGRWYCPHDCDDPSHGRNGRPRILDHGRYYRPGELISITNN